MQSKESLIITDSSLFEDGRKLPVMEAFYTIQGEGANTGKPAFFLRVGGCDVGCHWCDVKESWNAHLHPLTSVDSLLEQAIGCGAPAVVVTGGEPSMYPLDYLTGIFKKAGMQTFIETSGAYPLTGAWDWVCLSPKKNQAPLPVNFPKASELKCIIHNKHDFIWAEEQAKACLAVNPGVRLFLQPEWSKMNELMHNLVEYAKVHTQWSISLQTHKFMHIP